jgi:hypothetical protein
MRVRQQDANGDMTFGLGSLNYFVNNSAAVAQIIKTRLGLFLGEYWLDTTQGTDWYGSVLGTKTEITRDAEITAQILGVKGVAEILSYNSVYDPSKRTFSITGSVMTIYSTEPIELDASMSVFGTYGQSYGGAPYGA